jgi:hypothetical protein
VEWESNDLLSFLLLLDMDMLSTMHICELFVLFSCY